MPHRFLSKTSKNRNIQVQIRMALQCFVVLPLHMSFLYAAETRYKYIILWQFSFQSCCFNSQQQQLVVTRSSVYFHRAWQFTAAAVASDVYILSLVVNVRSLSSSSLLSLAVNSSTSNMWCLLSLSVNSSKSSSSLISLAVVLLPVCSMVVNGSSSSSSISVYLQFTAVASASDRQMSIIFSVWQSGSQRTQLEQQFSTQSGGQQQHERHVVSSQPVS